MRDLSGQVNTDYQDFIKEKSVCICENLCPIILKEGIKKWPKDVKFTNVAYVEI